eukprot:g1119.t1
MRQRRSFAVACAAEEATAPEAFPPAVIVGGGRLGEAFAKMGLRQDVIVRRGETFPSDAPEGPIYVCTRNDALEEVIRMVPEERHEETQPDAAHAELMKLAYSEEALLAKLEGELHKLSIRHASPIVKVSPDASHDHSEEVSEADEGNAPQKLPKFLGFGRTGTKAFAANAGGEASMSTASKMMKGDESDTHHHHYSINGIDGRLSFLLASFYVVELVLKLMVHRLFFFWNSEMSWNCFDFMLVVFSIFENLFTFLAFNTGDVAEESTGSGVNLAFLRLVRLCRIVKILRVFRTLKFFSELRLMLDCVLGSLMNVMWCVIMLVFVMYVFALLLQQGIVEHLTLVHARQEPCCLRCGAVHISRSQDGTDVEQLTTYFGSVGSTVVTLFQASTSGVDWNEPYQALRKTGMVMPMAFLGYVAFVFISAFGHDPVWNIVTSIFVEKALKLAMPDADMVIVEHQLQDAQDHKMLTKLFKSKSKSSDGIEQRLGLEEFRKLVETYEFRSYLQSRGIDIKNAETFFRMLVELQGETTIDATTFANACVRMKGAATSIDLQTVHWRLTSSDLACRILRDMEFKQAYWEKNLWISAYMMVGALHGCTVGEVESTHRKEVDELIGQLAVAVSASQADVTWERLLLCDRLAAYARSVAHFPTAVKEFEWRNGAFYEMKGYKNPKKYDGQLDGPEDLLSAQKEKVMQTDSAADRRPQLKGTGSLSKLGQLGQRDAMKLAKLFVQTQCLRSPGRRQHLRIRFACLQHVQCSRLHWDDEYGQACPPYEALPNALARVQFQDPTPPWILAEVDWRVQHTEMLNQKIEALEREKAMWEAKLRQLRGQTAGEPFAEASAEISRHAWSRAPGALQGSAREIFEKISHPQPLQSIAPPRSERQRLHDEAAQREEPAGLSSVPMEITEEVSQQLTMNDWLLFYGDLLNGNTRDKLADVDALEQAFMISVGASSLDSQMLYQCACSETIPDIMKKMLNHWVRSAVLSHQTMPFTAPGVATTTSPASRSSLEAPKVEAVRNETRGSKQSEGKDGKEENTGETARRSETMMAFEESKKEKDQKALEPERRSETTLFGEKSKEEKEQKVGEVMRRSKTRVDCMDSKLKGGQSGEFAQRSEITVSRKESKEEPKADGMARRTTMEEKEQTLPTGHRTETEAIDPNVKAAEAPSGTEAPDGELPEEAHEEDELFTKDQWVAWFKSADLDKEEEALLTSALLSVESEQQLSPEEMAQALKAFAAGSEEEQDQLHEWAQWALDINDD